MAEYNENESLMNNANRGVNITDPSADLPTYIELDKDEDFMLPDDMVEYINDYLADKYGYCNKGWCWKISLDDVEWDTTE